MTARVLRYSDELAVQSPSTQHVHLIGCVLLEDVFFFSRPEWIPEPDDWGAHTQRGKSYPAESRTAQVLVAAVTQRLSGDRLAFAENAAPRYGAPQLVAPRLGQGSFRAAVLEAYGRQCAVTGDRVIHVLQASHIRPFALGGPHDVTNGLLLRSDLHILYDRGYMTVTPNHRVEVSRALQEEFNNGREYLALSGTTLQIPKRGDDQPDHRPLAWHRDHVFRGQVA